MQREAPFPPQPQLMYLLPYSLISFNTLLFQVPLIKLIHLSPLIPSKASTRPVKGTSPVACCINKNEAYEIITLSLSTHSPLHFSLHSFL